MNHWPHGNNTVRNISMHVWFSRDGAALTCMNVPIKVAYQRILCTDVVIVLGVGYFVLHVFWLDTRASHYIASKLVFIFHLESLFDARALGMEQ
jgi:hypothetical protein